MALGRIAAGCVPPTIARKDSSVDDDHQHRDPERLAADAAVEAVEKIGPIHRRNADSIPQQLVDAGLGARLRVHALDDDGAVEAGARRAVRAAACRAGVPGTTTE